MPGKVSSVMDERLRFVACLLEGEGMSDVCRSWQDSAWASRKPTREYGSSAS